MPLASSTIDISVLQEFFPNVTQNYYQSGTAMNYDPVGASCYLEIATQPCEKFRFRYYSEPGSHGCISGRSSNGKAKKIFPTVKFVNPNRIGTRPIIIKASLYTAEDNPRPHVLSCLSKNNTEKNQDGACYEDLVKDSVQFKNLGIFTLKRDEIIAALQQRLKQELNISRLTKEQEESCVEKMKSYNLNETKLRFEALYKDDLTPVGCPAVFTDTICNSKATATGDLKICRLSLFKGSKVGEEDIIILCDKIKKDDVEIRFFETDGEIVVWETKAKFNPSDVHYQVAISFKIPKYEGSNTQPEIQVYIQLYRKSDGKYGDPVPFVYKNDIYPYPKKRKISEDSGIDDIQLNELLSCLDPNNYLNLESEDSSDYSMVPSDHSSSFPSDFVQKDAVNASGSLLNEDIEIEEIRDQFSNFSLSDSAAERSNAVKKFLECFSKGIHHLLKDKNILYYVPSSIMIQDTEGNSILHLAIIAKQSLKFIEAIIKLIKEDLVNHKNIDQKTAMHLATQHGNAELLKLLLNNGGNPHHTDKKGNSCLHIAAMNDFSKCLEAMLTFFPTEKEELASKINVENDDGLTPLHISILNDSNGCLKILLKNNADINKPEKKGGKSPLHLAVEKKSPFIENFLSQPNINIYCTDYRGLTALELACEENDIIYEEVPDEVIHDKENLLSYLKEKLEIETDDSSVQVNSGMANLDLQREIESILNKSSEWKRLGQLINFSEDQLQNLQELEENLAGCLIEKIMEEKQLGLKEIIERAGLTYLVSDVTGW